MDNKTGPQDVGTKQDRVKGFASRVSSSKRSAG
jgi:hypothetical protein